MDLNENMQWSHLIIIVLLFFWIYERTARASDDGPLLSFFPSNNKKGHCQNSRTQNVKSLPNQFGQNLKGQIPPLKNTGEKQEHTDMLATLSWLNLLKRLQHSLSTLNSLPNSFFLLFFFSDFLRVRAAARTENTMEIFKIQDSKRVFMRVFLFIITCPSLS